MKANALYFPYINVPRSNWLYSMALYWDEVSSIVPYEYVHHPERLSPFMGDLMRAGLVRPIIPTQYLPELRFAEPFLSYVEMRLQKGSPVLNADIQPPFRIHIEKLQTVSHELEQMRVIRRVEYPWFEAVRWVGSAFMAYLATCLGLLPELNAQPITADRESFRQLRGLGIHQRPTIEARRTRVRELVLEGLLPVPHDNDFEIHKLLRFKEKHGDKLKRFRRHIEGVCLDFANRPTLEEEQLQLRIEDLQEEADELGRRMRSSWRDITLRDVMPLVSLGASLVQPGNGLWSTVGTGSALVAAIAQFAGSIQERRVAADCPLAYAALARFSSLRSLPKPK